MHNYEYLVVVGVISLDNAEVNLRHFGFAVTNVAFGTTTMMSLIILMIVLWAEDLIRFSSKVFSVKQPKKSGD